MLTRVLLTIAILIMASGTFAQCPVDTVMIRGRVENAPPNARIRVRLVYAKQRGGDAGETGLENGKFSIPLQFITKSSAPIRDGFFVRCKRKPESVTISLLGDDGRESDHVSLDFKKDFVSIDPSAYAPKSEIVLRPSVER